MKKDPTMSAIVDKVYASLVKQGVTDVEPELIFEIIDYQFRAVNKAMKSGKEILLPNFGTFGYLYEVPYSRLAKFVEEKGGIENVLKVPEVTEQIKEKQIIEDNPKAKLSPQILSNMKVFAKRHPRGSQKLVDRGDKTLDD